MTSYLSNRETRPLLSPDLIGEFTRAATSPKADLAGAALVIARLEYPHLDPSTYLERLDAMGADATERLERVPAGRDPLGPVVALNRYLFDEQGFVGNMAHYDDLRNSFLNKVLDRRTGIPITLAVVYIEVARRAGMRVEGVNFPGHFLLRIPAGAEAGGAAEDLILDPFHGGALLSEADCRGLLRRHLGEDAAFDPGLLAPATKQQILVRILVNLKRIYWRLRSFPQARDTTELLFALDPAALSELRDRGLLAYHLRDFASALRDLEAYLHYTPRSESADQESHEEYEQIWEYVKTLRRHVASMN